LLEVRKENLIEHSIIKTMKMDKKGMVQQLTVIGYAIIGLVVLVGIGLVVLDKLGSAVGGTANTSIQYGMTQLGSTGLLSWLPAVIALLIGVFFLAYFAGGGIAGKK
jgi:predicted anti-sigma-YlaC factor YlaD